jgi:predicted metal-dependent enzyme (double-stranded beta helix superfamily)
MNTATPIFCPATLGLELPDCGAAGPSPRDQQAVLAALGTAKIDWSVFGPHLAFDHELYVRRRLYRNENWEILLLCWLPGHKTAIHDHGDSWGATLVLMGDLVESQYQWHGRGIPLTMKGDSPLGERQITVETQSTIHTVSNRSAAPAASLHLYSPPLDFLHAYDALSGDQNRVEPAESRFYTR